MKQTKIFFKDYVALCKESIKWFKKHWKGYCLFVSGLSILTGVATWEMLDTMWINTKRWTIHEIKEKRKKNNVE